MYRMLSNEDILEIKRKYYEEGGVKQSDLAKEYSCSVMTISLWLKEDPYTIIKKKTRSRQSGYVGRARCEVCSRVIDDEQGVITPCDCQKPKQYYSSKVTGPRDISKTLTDERKSFYI